MSGDQKNKQVISPYFAIGHSPYAMRETVWALTDHSFLTPTAAKIAINSGAQGGEVKFVPGLDTWREVTNCQISEDKHYFAVCVRGHLIEPGEQSFNVGPTPTHKARKINKKQTTEEEEQEDRLFDGAVLIYKLPWMEHGDPNPEMKEVNLKKPEITVSLVLRLTEEGVLRRARCPCFHTMLTRPPYFINTGTWGCS